MTLAELVAIGLSLARVVEAQTHHLTRSEPSQAIAQHLPNLTKAFDRLARTIRQTVALDARLATKLTTATATTIETDAERARRIARRRILRAAEDTIEHRAPKAERENLLRDLHERLDDPDFDEALLTTDPAQFLDQLACDLGIALPIPPYTSPRSQAAIATLNARAAAPPRVAPPPARPPPPFPTG